MTALDMWSSLQEFGDTFTCYSAALATWAAFDDPDWPAVVNPGLALTVSDEDGLLLGFAHFPPQLRSELSLQRTGADAAEGDAIEGVLAELQRSGRVIIAGDGFNLPWHVAHGRAHVPHWFVLGGDPDALEVLDPFACRNELGVQAAARRPLDRADLPVLLGALSREDPVFALREVLAFGDDTRPSDTRPWQWFTRSDVADVRSPDGVHGPAAVSRLADHFRAHGQDPAAYAQTDDVWSIARHRAFLVRHLAATAARRGDGGLADWVGEHGEPMAKRWGHMAPLLMQARLALAAGRSASASVPDTLDELATRERAAAAAFPDHLQLASI
jgi:hypothetical protein